MTEFDTLYILQYNERSVASTNKISRRHFVQKHVMRTCDFFRREKVIWKES